MPKYRKKPVVIEAEQWWPGVEIDGVDESHAALLAHGAPANHAIIDTLEGVMIVSPGDYVITGVRGEKYPCKPEIFAETYEPVTDEGEE